MSRTIFVTGATGFIGGRLAEAACARGDSIVTLVRTWSRVPRIARLPVRMVGGDLLDRTAVTRAMAGADVVFHCAVDNRVCGELHIQTGLRAVENVLHAAHENHVPRVVHLSSVAVYGYRPGHDAAVEDGAFAEIDDHYCRGKIEAERTARKLSSELSVPLVVLRPTIVYGPFGGWTVDTVDRLMRGRQAIVDKGDGVCNALYVDNLVDAMLLAADADGAVGETFHVSDAVPTTWRRFVEAHAEAASIRSADIPRCSVDAARAAHRSAKRASRPMTSLRRASQLLHDPQFRWALTSVPIIDRSVRFTKRAAQAMLPAGARSRVRYSLFGDDSAVVTAAPPVPSPTELAIYANSVVFRIDKARQLLGYEPRVDFEEGMRRTRAWIKWANLCRPARKLRTREAESTGAERADACAGRPAVSWRGGGSDRGRVARRGSDR